MFLNYAIDSIIICCLVFMRALSDIKWIGLQNASVVMKVKSLLIKTKKLWVNKYNWKLRANAANSTRWKNNSYFSQLLANTFALAGDLRHGKRFCAHDFYMLHFRTAVYSLTKQCYQN